MPRLLKSILAIWTGIVACGLSAAWALEPPTREQLERYRRDGTLAERIRAARAFGNHQVSPQLVAAFKDRLNGAGHATAAGSKVLPSTGTQKVFALLVDFDDYRGVNGQPQIYDKLFGAGDPADFPAESLSNFYRRSSYGMLEIEGAALGWYTTPYPRSQVNDNEPLIAEAIQHFEAEGHDFAQYDNDGDGTIDYFLVIWAGPVGEWGEFWWGYQTRYQDPSFRVDGKRLGTYSWQWEVASAFQSFDPYVTIHETGHALGLPDYYDYDTSVGPGGGVGGLDQMDGNWGDHNCFSKWMLGWLTPEIYNQGSHSVLLDPGEVAPSAVLLMHGNQPVDPFAEYYMVQYRRRQGNDFTVPNDGLLIWHVDARLDDGGWFVNDNSYTPTKLLRLMEADGLEEIERNIRADAEDFYVPGAAFGPDTFPSSSRNDGVPTTVSVDDIAAVGDQMSVRAGVASGCAIYCQVAGGAVAWPGVPEQFWAEVGDRVNCDGEVSIKWAFGDGSVSDEISTDHVYREPGTYEWSFDARIGEATCPGHGTMLVCRDERCFNWWETTPMNATRSLHEAVALEDGRLMVVGGTTGAAFAEVFDPRDKGWTPTAAPSAAMATPLTATLLADGRVFVTDGRSFEIYDPAADQWTPVAQHANDRFHHGATLLADGRVLVAGGAYNGADVLEAELYDPSSDTWSSGGALTHGVVQAELITLDDGRAFLFAPTQGETMLFDPQTRTWEDISVIGGFELESATKLASGEVLVVAHADSAQIGLMFRPATNNWGLIWSLGTPRIGAKVTPLPSGKVLMTGGWSLAGWDWALDAEIIDPFSSTASTLDGMSMARHSHTATLLASGGVLVAGGRSTGGPTASAEYLVSPSIPPRLPSGRLLP